LGRCHLFRVTATDHVSNESSVVAAWQTCVPQQVVKYYVHGGARVAMRAGDVVTYIHTDHLGSTSLTTGEDGAVKSRQGYLPYGELQVAD
jgi:hypothetical protein